MTLKDDNMNNKKCKIFFCEKTGDAQEILKRIGKNGDISISTPTVRSYSFSYPKKIPYNTIPVRDLIPEYKNNFIHSVVYGFVYLKKEDGSIEKTEINPLINYLKLKFQIEKSESSFHSKEKSVDLRNKAQEYIESFGEIVYACGNDLSGLRGFDFYFEKYLEYYNYEFNLDYKNIKITYIDSSCMNTTIENEFSKKSIFIDNEKVNDFRNSYKKKDFFEYNFNVNSLVIIGDILRKNGFISNCILTKNLFLTLLIIQKIGKCNEHQLIDEMNKLDIGNVASHIHIIETLYDNGLIWYGLYKNSNQEKKCIMLANETESFFEYIHPKMKDFKMSINVMDDVKNPDIDLMFFKEKYGNKLQTMFSKQKNFLRKKYRDEALKNDIEIELKS
jgi:hypothetical protein